MPTETIEGFPLSLQQKRHWSFLSTAPAHELVSKAVYLIEGNLDRAMFEQALRRVMERHEICRSVYKSIPGLPEPVQVLEEEVALHASATGRRLENAPIFDWEITAIRADQHELRVQFPAASADYSTLELFANDLARQYQHAVAGTEDGSEPMQYLDYAQWQIDLQSSSEARPGQQFWRNFEQEAVRHALALETGAETFQSAVEERRIDSALLADVSGSATGAGVSNDTLILAAWAAFCAQLGESDSEVTLGIYSNGRNFEELKEALGPYDRYLPVRIAIAHEDPAEIVVQTAQAGFAAAQQHQEFFAAGTQKSGRDEAMEFLFAYRTSAAHAESPRISISIRSALSHSEPFKLKLEYVDGAAPALRLFYNSKRFSAEYGSILADRFETFLREFASRQKVPVRELKIASAAEIAIALNRFARQAPAEPAAPTVLELFDAKVAHHPQRPALICGGEVLTYAELDARANRLAHRLLGLGVRSGAPVALSAERSFEMIVGLLGIQKAGGAYVPLDPSYPKERLESVLHDCGAEVLVATPNLLARLPVHRGHMVALSDSALAGESSKAPDVAIQPGNSAYIIYTSGSTGQPKGVPITHRNLAYSTAARLAFYQEPISNYLLLSSFAFDSSIAGIFWSLAQGATLTIPREGTQQDPKELLALIREYKVSHLLALPSFYQAIIDQASPLDVASLTTVIVAGEACTVDLVQRHYRKVPKAQLFNEYGPTEGTVWSTVHRCDRAEAGVVPIGRPVPNMSIYILDERRRPSGVGQLGEIYIGGPAVASGYLHRAELTSEKFVADPFNDNGTRLYRTGDLGRFRTDGLIEFHGRIDEQVKIRGFRIEIGEIECVLGRHPDVREAVVALREDTPGEKRLVAYVVPKDQAHLSIPELRLFAQDKLPQFMIPAQFVSLRTLPLMPNGKIDRKTLPVPEELERSEKRYLAPRNPDEEQLARIWSDVLKLEKVGIEENFFDLGGHSLLAIQVIARVRDSFKLELPMAAFFEAPTIGGMAVALGRCRESKGTTGGGIRRVARVAATDELLAKLKSSSD